MFLFHFIKFIFSKNKHAFLKDGDYILSHELSSKEAIALVISTGKGSFEHIYKPKPKEYYALVYNENIDFWQWVKNKCPACKKRIKFQKILDVLESKR